MAEYIDVGWQVPCRPNHEKQKIWIKRDIDIGYTLYVDNIPPKVRSQRVIANFEDNRIHLIYVQNICTLNGPKQSNIQRAIRFSGCVTPTITKNVNTVNFSFSHLGGSIDKYVVRLLASDNSEVSSKVITEISSTITGSFTGLSSVVGIKIKVDIYAAEFKNDGCPPVASPNIGPTANAGPAKHIKLPNNTVTLNGSGSTDPDGTIVAYHWEQMSGPAAATFVTPNAVTTVVNDLVEGNYVMKLTVTDNSGESDDDQVTVEVAPNLPPYADAGPDQTIALPNNASLTGSGTDPDGTIVAYHWEQMSGPNTATINTPDSANTTVSGLVAGTYVFKLTVTDNDGNTGSDIIQLIVNNTITAWEFKDTACEEDNVFTQTGQIVNLSSPGILMYDSVLDRVYGIDLDGRFFYYSPSATTIADITYIPFTLKPGATPWAFSGGFDRQYRRMYAVGRDTDGLQSLDIDTGVITVVPFGFNENVPPMGGTGSHNGYNRLNVTVFDTTILTVCKYAQAIYIIDRASLTITTTIPLSSITDYDKCLIGAPIITKVGNEYWVVQSQGNGGEAPNQSANIFRYNLTFSNTPTTINLSAWSTRWTYNALIRSTYYDAESNIFYVVDFGSSSVIKVDTLTGTANLVRQFTNRGGKSAGGFSFIIDPITGELFASGGWSDSLVDTIPKLFTYKWDKITDQIISFLPGINFMQLERIGSSRVLHGAQIGQQGANGFPGWDTDGKILKFQR